MICDPIGHDGGIFRFRLIPKDQIALDQEQVLMAGLKL